MPSPHLGGWAPQGGSQQHQDTLSRAGLLERVRPQEGGPSLLSCSGCWAQRLRGGGWEAAA